MEKAVFFCSFKLNKGASAEDFMKAAENLNNEYISKQKGYVSWRQLVDGDMWADVITFESMQDVLQFEADSGNAGELAQKFYTSINLDSCTVNRFLIERSYT